MAKFTIEKVCDYPIFPDPWVEPRRTLSEVIQC